MNFREVQQAIDAAVRAKLAEAGFWRAAAGIWNRRRAEEFNVVQLQAHSANKTFCVNLGIHYAFLPKAGSEAPFDGGQIELPDCELQLRLTEQTKIKDQWWPIAAPSVNQVAHLVCSRGLSIFELYQLDGSISALDGKSVESGKAELLAPLTKVRACLLLARIHEHLGNRDKSIEAAAIGLRLAGMAVGPKVVLRDIRKRLG